MGSRRTAANTSIATSRRPSFRSARKRIEHVGGEPASLFVDSGAWIALASARDQHHAEADSLFRIAATLRLPLLTTNLVVAEVHRFLLHRAGTAVAARALDRLESSPRLAVEFVRPEHHRAARKGAGGAPVWGRAPRGQNRPGGGPGGGGNPPLRVS